MFISGVKDRFRVVVICRAAKTRGRAVRFTILIRYFSAIRRAKGGVISTKDLSAERSSACISNERVSDFTFGRLGRQRTMDIERRNFSDFLIDG